MSLLEPILGIDFFIALPADFPLDVIERIAVLASAAAVIF